MLHESIASRYVKQRRIYGRVLRILFACAGVFWIIIYAVPGLTTETKLALRGGQTLIYFVLLTIWGLDYMREERRLGCVVQTANRMSTLPNMVTLTDVQGKATLFTMIVPPKGTSWSIWNVIFVIGLLVGATLTVWQYVRLVVAITST